MTIKKPYAMSMVILAALAATTTAFAAQTDAAREQLHHVDLWSRDLIPAFAVQMRDPGARNGSDYNYGLGSDQLQAMMALGRFRGETEAFHELWDRYSNASLYGPLRDMDSSFRTADSSIRRSRNNGDVTSRWSHIRQAYFQFRRDVDLDGNSYNAGRPWYNGANDYNNSPNPNGSGYYDNNGTYHSSRNNNGRPNNNGYYDNNGNFHSNRNNNNDTGDNGYYDNNGNYHSNNTQDITDGSDVPPDVQPHIEVNPGP